jgi:hypothetical protein
MAFRSRWRCFWSWPIGHRWERRVEGQHAYKRCGGCGKTKGGGFRPPHDAPHHFGGGTD